MPSAQLSAAIRDLERHKRMFDADVVGERVLDIVADQITREMDAETDPDGTPWPALSESYAEWKSRHYPGQEMAVLEGLMKSPSQIRGERVITRDEASMTYGVDAEAKQEAAWFSARRPFYAMSAECVRRIEEYLAKVQAKG